MVRLDDRSRMAPSVDSINVGFDKDKFVERFGPRKSIAPGSFSEEFVFDIYERLIRSVEQSLQGGNEEEYFKAVGSLAHFIGAEILESNKGRNDLTLTNREAAMALRDFPFSEETKQLIGSGHDWVRTTDTKTNQDVPHYSDDRTSKINSYDFGEGTVEEINFRGCGYVTAALVEGIYEKYKRHSPFMVEVRVNGWKPSVPEVMFQGESINWEEHKVEDDISDQ